MARHIVVDVRPAGKADVYCLSVPGDRCFSLASGHIVGNSDAIGYYTYQLFPIIKPPVAMVDLSAML